MKPVHIVANYLVNPPSAITVNVIGAGGTGSQVLHHLARINGALRERRHPGLQVTAFDSDEVTAANMIRQRFSEEEIGENKAVALITKLNRHYGTNWKAATYRFCKKTAAQIKNQLAANITITCLDTIRDRFEIADLISGLKGSRYYSHNRPLYWMDFGNAKYTGQVVLSTVGSIEQPRSKQFEPVAELPFVTDEFKNLLKQQKKSEKNIPSCSLTEALNQQDLFINTQLAGAGCGLLWNMITEAMTDIRGVFINVKTFRMQPIPVSLPAEKKRMDKPPNRKIAA